MSDGRGRWTAADDRFLEDEFSAPPKSDSAPIPAPPRPSPPPSPSLSSSSARRLCSSCQSSSGNKSQREWSIVAYGEQDSFYIICFNKIILNSRQLGSKHSKNLDYRLYRQYIRRKSAERIPAHDIVSVSLTNGPSSEGVIIELIDFIFLFYQSVVFLLQRAVFIQGLKAPQERKAMGRQSGTQKIK